ncbi:MAG: hypothetical protein LC687_02240 [Actinobacteria bacterium]|nr:hypothetical protein [Actinomycetota bacterium]
MPKYKVSEYLADRCSYQEPTYSNNVPLEVAELLENPDHKRVTLQRPNGDQITYEKIQSKYQYFDQITKHWTNTDTVPQWVETALTINPDCTINLNKKDSGTNIIAYRLNN